jgi:alpha-glucosidase
VMTLQNHEWWRNAVTYQIYPRSFADGTGDGIGDLAGVISRVDYLARLGVDAVWLSPFYPSELADGGYDVANYRDIDPRIGTLDQFDEMVSALRESGIRVIVDIVPNHSSDQHEWFKAALAAGRGSPERERYIFREGRGEHGELPPNDWPSHFGPTSWTRVADGQWYLHLFAPEQPDFNWDHPEVHADFLTTLRFWGDRGVAGFRVDVAHGLVKDMSEPYSSVTGLTVDHLPDDGSHPLLDRDDVHEVFRSWRAVLNEYDPPLVAVAESWAPTDRRARYASPEGLGQTFNFDLVTASWNADDYREAIEPNLKHAADSGSSTTWVLSNHDVVRHATRYGLDATVDLSAWLMADGHDPEVDTDLGRRRARAATMLMLALPGAAYLYQGEELGLFEVADIPRDALQDPIWLRTNGTEKGRDGCRVPIPWAADEPGFGFGSATPHLPQPDWFGDFAADRQEGDGSSMLEFYRAALALRRRLLGGAALVSGDGLTWRASPEGTLHFARSIAWESVTNFTAELVALPAGSILATSDSLVDGLLPAGTTAWLDPR